MRFRRCAIVSFILLASSGFSLVLIAAVISLYASSEGGAFRNESVCEGKSFFTVSSALTFDLYLVNRSSILFSSSTSISLSSFFKGSFVDPGKFFFVFSFGFSIWAHSITSQQKTWLI